METFLRCTKDALKKLSDYTIVHVVISNEACDLDSTASALVFAFYLDQSTEKNGKTLFLPVLNIPREAFRLRTETSFLLNKLGIAADILTFESEVDLEELHSRRKLRLTLVDHHVPTPRLSRFSDDVVTVVDHRPLEREITNCECHIELVGSCTTLIAEQIFKNTSFTLDSISATLLCAAILTDTINLSPEAGKVTGKDVEIFDRLRKIIPDVDMQNLYDEIQKAKFDLSNLTVMELLEKDLKMVSGQGLTIAMCSVTMGMKDLLQKEGVMESLSEFCKVKSASVAIIMTLEVSQDGLPQRQLAVYSPSRIYRHQIIDVLQSSQNPHLNLEPFIITSNHSSDNNDNIVTFTQHNVAASRKQVLPVLRSFLSGEKTPDEESSSRLLLTSTNENDFTALGVLVTGTPDSGMGEGVRNELYECEDSHSGPFSSSRSEEDDGEDVDVDVSSRVQPVVTSDMFDQLLSELSGDAAGHARNYNTNSLDAFDPLADLPRADAVGEGEGRADPLSEVSKKNPLLKEEDPSSATENPLSADPAACDSLLVDLSSADPHPHPHPPEQTVNKTVNVLSVGDDNSLISLEDNTFEFTDAELQPPTGQAGFYLSSDNLVDAEVNSGSGTKVNSYPETPPNSYMTPGNETEFVDRSLPSFNSSEMAQRLRAKNMTKGSDDGVAVGADDGAVEDVDDDDGGDGETYTPQNSYSESAIHVSKEKIQIPCFSHQDMVQRVHDKRASLKGYDVSDDDDDVDDDESRDEFPWTPNKSCTDKKFGKSNERSFSGEGTIFENKNLLDVACGSPNSVPEHPPVSRTDSSYFEEEEEEVQTDLNKVAHRLSLVHTDDGVVDDFSQFQSLEKLGEHSVESESDFNNSGNSDGGAEEKETLTKDKNSFRTSPGNSLESPEISEESSENVVAMETGEQATEEDGGCRSDSGIKVVSENVVAMEIAQRMIEEEKTESLVKTYEKVLNSSENVVVRNLVCEMSRELSETEKSEQTQFVPGKDKNHPQSKRGKELVDVYQKLNDLEENVVARNIAKQMMDDQKGDKSGNNADHPGAGNLLEHLENTDSEEHELESERYKLKNESLESENNKSESNNSVLLPQSGDCNRHCDISDAKVLQADGSCLSDTDIAEAAVLEVAFKLSNELIHQALETFASNVRDTTEAPRSRAGSTKKLTKNYNGSDYSIETEYLPEMDPLHGGLDISQESHLISTDAGREVVEGASFRKISGQSRDGGDDEVVLRRFDSVSETNERRAGEVGGEVDDVVSGQSRSDDDRRTEDDSVTDLNCFSGGESEESRSEEKSHKIIHVPTELASSIHESIEGDLHTNDDADNKRGGDGGDDDDAADPRFEKKVIHLEKDIDFDSSLGTDVSFLSEYTQSRGNNSSDFQSKGEDSYTSKGDKSSDFQSSEENMSFSPEDSSLETTGDNSADLKKEDNSAEPKGDNSSVKKEVYMTTAGRISIEGSQSSSGVWCGGGRGSSEGLDPLSEEYHRQVGSFIQRADELVARVDEELDVFYPNTEVAPHSHPHVLHLSAQNSDAEPASNEPHKGHNSNSSLEAKNEDGSQAAGLGKSAAERPQSLNTRKQTKEKKKIVPDINLIGDDSSNNIDDVETPDDLRLQDDIDEDDLGELEWENDSPVHTPDDGCDPIEEYSEEEEKRDARNWKTVRLGDRQFRIDLKVIEPYKKVLSHGGYYGDGLNAIILFSGCYLPDRRRKDYHYVMDNLFYYVVHTLEQLVAEDYMIIYFHGATPKKQMPSFGWMKKCYQMIDRRLRKNLKALLLVHPTIWLKTVVMMTRPFISSKFSAKLRFVRCLDDLRKLVPMEYIYVPEQVQAYDDHLMNRSNPNKPSSSSS